MAGNRGFLTLRTCETCGSAVDVNAYGWDSHVAYHKARKEPIPDGDVETVLESPNIRRRSSRVQNQV